jgi:hypothetical protein
MFVALSLANTTDVRPVAALDAMVSANVLDRATGTELDCAAVAVRRLASIRPSHH